MKKLLIIFNILLLFNISAQAADKNKALKFLKSEILGADAQTNMEKSLRAIKQTKKVLSIVDENGEKAVEIKITKKLKGHKDDWNNSQQRSQRWELDTKNKDYIKHGIPLYAKYTFKLDDKSKAEGSILQTVGTDKKGVPILPSTHIAYWSEEDDDKRVVFSYWLVKRVARPCDEDNLWFDKTTYYFTLGYQKEFKNFNTIAFKYIPSKDKNGELIMWLNDEKIIELFGPNVVVGEGTKFKLGVYRWLNKKSKGPTSLTIKEFSYSENCEEVLDGEKCNYDPVKKRAKGTSFSWVPFKKKSRNDIKDNVKYCKILEGNMPPEGLKIYSTGRGY